MCRCRRLPSGECFRAEDQTGNRGRDDASFGSEPDIAASLGAIKREGQVMVGFALETNDEATHAEGKLKRKNLDFIVLNSLRDQGAGFRCDTNKITIIDNAGGVTSYPLKTKREVACDIVNKLVTLLK